VAPPGDCRSTTKIKLDTDVEALVPLVPRSAPARLKMLALHADRTPFPAVQLRRFEAG
jgi:hypothetical protein